MSPPDGVGMGFFAYWGCFLIESMLYSVQQIKGCGGAVMRMEKKSKRYGRSGTDPVVALTWIFVVLKVMGLISWSWLWVLSPMWLTFLFFAVIFLPFWPVDESPRENGNFQLVALPHKKNLEQHAPIRKPELFGRSALQLWFLLCDNVFTCVRSASAGQTSCRPRCPHRGCCRRT